MTAHRDAPYYQITSESESPNTNLQLYSFRQAKEYWHQLCDAYCEFREDTPLLKERCVFIVNALGLSISQLLGVRNPRVYDKVPSPSNLFEAFSKKYTLSEDLEQRFKAFNAYYDGTRHFGPDTCGKGFGRVNDLSFTETKACFEFTVDLWKAVVEVHNRENGTEINFEEFLKEELDIDDSTEYDGPI